MEIASLAGLDGLADLGLRSGADMRPTLLRILTDLYVQKFRHTPAEERHYTELALRLLDAVEVGTRAAVAGKLAHHLSPPLPVLQHLSRDVAEVAEPLRAHPLLQPPAPAQAFGRDGQTGPSRPVRAATSSSARAGASPRARAAPGSRSRRR